MRIVLSYQSGVPIYEQIKEQIKSSIITGEMKEGEWLPSIRQLARDLKVSVITTTRAYGDLELEGYLSTVPSKGYYVQKMDYDIVRQRYLEETKTALTAAVRSGKTAGLSMAELHELLNAMEEKADV